MADRCDDPLFGEVPERVLLSSAPLVRVLGQVKFPRIAKIAEESYIANFQEAIRGEYPHFQSIRLDQAPFWTHKRSALTRVFANSMSFRIRAVMATLAGFPALRSLS